MIVSVSRRTDIPAFYSDWFFQRLREGYAITRNPMNPKQLRRVELTVDAVDGFVFWSKNPAPMLPKLDLLLDYPCYFQFTLNPYGAEIEPGLPSVEERLETFCRLSENTSPERVIWRYDPIFLSPEFPLEYHFAQFEWMAKILSGKTKRCVISFVDPYAKKAKNFQRYQIRELNVEEMNAVAAAFSQIAREYGLQLQTCAELIDLDQYGIPHGKCVDAALLSQIAGKPIATGKDSGQRKACGCAPSVDIGAYHTCPHGCRYCYASGSETTVEKYIRQYNPMSPILCGTLTNDRKNELVR